MQMGGQWNVGARDACNYLRPNPKEYVAGSRGGFSPRNLSGTNSDGGYCELHSRETALIQPSLQDIYPTMNAKRTKH